MLLVGNITPERGGERQMQVAVRNLFAHCDRARGHRQSDGPLEPAN